MTKLPVLGILVLMLLVVSGYVASEPSEIANEAGNDVPVVSADPHVNYYEHYLAITGLNQPAR